MKIMILGPFREFRDPQFSSMFIVELEESVVAMSLLESAELITVRN